MTIPSKRSSTFPCLSDISAAGKAQGAGFGWASGNWSGYALSGKKGVFRRISGEWHVPFVRPSASAAYSSAWIGIDGFQNASLIQTGTAHEYVNGVVRYYAWWEILPAVETVIPLPVFPGDRMRAVIVKLCRGKWSISLRNLTRNWTFRTARRYNGPQTSAEWIVEAPLVGGAGSQLALISPVAFSRCRVNGANPRLTPSSGGVMIQNNRIVAVPSPPEPLGEGFLRKTQSRQSATAPIIA